MRKIILILLIVPFFGCSAQNNFKLEGQIDSLPQKTIYLLDFYGIENNLVDSTTANSAGFFDFDFDESTPNGMYRLVMAGRHFDFIYNKENIEFKTSYNHLIDSMKIIESVENQIMVDYLKFMNSIQKKFVELNKLKAVYKEGDEFYDNINKEIKDLQVNSLQGYTSRLISDYPDSYFSRFLKTEQSPIVPDSLPREKVIDFLEEHLFDSTDFNDSALIRSPVYITKVRAYFTLFNNYGTFDEVEQAYIKALDRLMSKAAVNDQVFNFLLEDISNGFEKSEYELFFAYLTENYLLGSSCKNEEDEAELRERLEFFKLLADGNTGPDFTIFLEDSTALVLSEMKSEYKLLIFWASWCGHCGIMMPEIKKIYDEFKSSDFEVLAISIDNVEQEWRDAIAKNNYNWINYSELKGWDGSVALKYGIRATPSFLLLNKDNKIILKPRTTDQLKRKLEQLF